MNCKRCIHRRVCRYEISLVTRHALRYPLRLDCREYRQAVRIGQSYRSEIRWPKPIPAIINDSWFHNGEICETSKRAIEEWELNERMRNLVRH